MFTGIVSGLGRITAVAPLGADPTHGKQLELDPFVVAAAFDLTPAEARVAVAAAQGVGADDIARRHGVSTHTVRSQLKTIFQKTGTERHAELVSLLAGLPMAALGLGVQSVESPAP